LADAEIASLYNSGNGLRVGPCIPTVSEWGVGVMLLSLLTAGTVVAMKRAVHAPR